MYVNFMIFFFLINVFEHNIIFDNKVLLYYCIQEDQKHFCLKISTITVKNIINIELISKNIRPFHSK